MRFSDYEKGAPAEAPSFQFIKIQMIKISDPQQLYGIFVQDLIHQVGTQI